MKKILVGIFIILFMFQTSTFAHSTLTKSSPADGQIAGNNLNELILEFDTPIENTSTITLISETGEQIPVEVSVDNNTIVGKINAQLKQGTYQVSWDIVGEDGHPINGTYLFMVDASETTQSPSDQLDSGSGGSFNWMGIVLGIIVVLIIVTLFTKKR